MKLLIVGASGATGHHLVRLALAQGHQVTAFVRASGLDQAVSGQDAVVCALGVMPDTRADLHRRQPGVPVCSVGTSNLLAAMARCGWRRIVVASSASVGHSRRTSVLGAAGVVRGILRQVMDDKERQEAAVMASATDWTIVRPAKLTNGRARGAVRSGEDLRWSLLSHVSRADTAAFMLATLTDHASFRKALTITS